MGFVVLAFICGGCFGFFLSSLLKSSSYSELMNEYLMLLEEQKNNK